jgi:hypothetical protein
LDRGVGLSIEGLAFYFFRNTVTLAVIGLKYLNSENDGVRQIS